MDDVDELIDRCRQKLGDPDGVYRPAPTWKLLLLGGGLLVGGLILGGGVLAVAPKLAAGMGKALAVAPVAGVIILYHGLVARGRAVLTYPDGLLPVGRGAVDWIPWEAVGLLTLRAKAPTPVAGALAVSRPLVFLNTARLTVGREGGEPLVIRPALIGYEELVLRVQRERFARQWPGLQERLFAGEVLPFGTLDLSLDGVGKGSKTLRWAKVKSVEVKGNRVVVKRAYRWLAWAAVGLEGVPDPHLFLAVVEQARAADERAAEVGDGPG